MVSHVFKIEIEWIRTESDDDGDGEPCRCRAELDSADDEGTCPTSSFLHRRPTSAHPPPLIRLLAYVR